jgi:hypothetical protein
VAVAVPEDTPVTTPVVLIVAITGLLLLQVPPGVAAVNDVVVPAQKLNGPIIGDGDGFTVTVVIAYPVPIS